MYALCGPSVAFLAADPLCYALWDAWIGRPSWLRRCMSCDGLVTTWRPPDIVRLTPGAVSSQLCTGLAHGICWCVLLSFLMAGQLPFYDVAFRCVASAVQCLWRGVVMSADMAGTINVALVLLVLGAALSKGS